MSTVLCYGDSNTYGYEISAECTLSRQAADAVG